MRLVPIATALVLAGIATGRAVARYACTLECAGQGRGISAIVALGGDQFPVLERNNRGVGVGANVASPDKNVFEIDLSGAADVTGINLPATGNFAGAVTKVAKVAKVMADPGAGISVLRDLPIAMRRRNAKRA